MLATGELWSLGKGLVVPRAALVEACDRELEILDRTFPARCRAFLSITRDRAGLAKL